MRTLSLPLLAMMVPALLTVGCNKTDTDADTDTDDTDASGDTDVPVEDMAIRFRVRGLEVAGTSVDVPDLEGATCEWTRRTGESWDTPETTKTDADGFCTLMIPEDRNTVTVKVTLADYVDVLAAGFPARRFEEDNAENTTTGVLMFTEAQADGFYDFFKQERDETNGYVTGVVTWRPTGQGALQPIGCASVDATDANPGFDLYLGGTLKDPRTNTDPRVGTWLGFDIAPGSYTFEATIDGTGETRQAVVPVLANTFTNIPLFFPAESNPTPSDCQ